MSHNLGLKPERIEVDFTSLKLQVFPGGMTPPELFDLRKKVYGDETGFLRDEDLFTDNDLVGSHICLYDERTGRLAAASHFADADQCDFAEHSGIPKADLSHCFYSSRSIVDPAYRGNNLFNLLLYLALRENRIKGKRVLLAYIEPGDIPARRLVLPIDLPHVPKRMISGRDGSQYEVVAVGQDINYGLHILFGNMGEKMQGWVAENLMAEEIEKTVKARITQFYENPWIQAVRNGSLTRNQYIDALANMHQFVRWTTRLLAKIAGSTHERELRSHYLEHLSGEVDHELMIETDLAYLGYDVDFVTQHMSPKPDIRVFMSIQESMAAFHQDPVLFLAVPFSIEGLSGHLDKAFIDALNGCIRSWGYDQPKRGSLFFASHIHTDGGEDGHWVMSRNMIKRYVRTETRLQAFLTIVNSVMDSQDRMYADYMRFTDFMELKPARLGALRSPDLKTTLDKVTAPIKERGPTASVTP